MFDKLMDRVVVPVMVIGLLLLCLITVWSMVGVVGDMAGWWDGWVSDR